MQHFSTDLFYKRVSESTSPGTIITAWPREAEEEEDI